MRLDCASDANREVCGSTSAGPRREPSARLRMLFSGRAALHALRRTRRARHDDLAPLGCRPQHAVISQQVRRSRGTSSASRVRQSGGSNTIAEVPSRQRRRGAEITLPSPCSPHLTSPRQRARAVSVPFENQLIEARTPQRQSGQSTLAKYSGDKCVREQRILTRKWLATVPPRHPVSKSHGSRTDHSGKNSALSRAFRIASPTHSSTPK